MTESDNRLWKLHVRKARGEDLTSTEWADLDAWYDEQDQIEAASLGVASNLGTLEPLQEQVNAVLQRIIATSQTIQAIAAENEIVRQENRALRHLLAQQRAFQPT